MAKDLRVLVVEDDPDAAESLQRLLASYGYQVTLAGTVQEGLTIARRIQPHIVLCDIGLPDSDGYVVASVLRQTARTSGARLVAVTALSQPQDRRRALAAGFDAHLAKPVDLRALLGEMETTL